MAWAKCDEFRYEDCFVCENHLNIVMEYAARASSPHCAAPAPRGGIVRRVLPRAPHPLQSRYPVLPARLWRTRARYSATVSLSGLGFGCHTGGALANRISECQGAAHSSAHVCHTPYDVHVSYPVQVPAVIPHTAERGSGECDPASAAVLAPSRCGANIGYSAPISGCARPDGLTAQRRACR